MVSALLLGITFSDLKRFFVVSLPFDAFERDLFNELHSLGICSFNAVSGGSFWLAGGGGIGCVGSGVGSGVGKGRVDFFVNGALP
jgi:hypothetical protein